ncbi:MAG: ATP-binding protein, partial [Methanobrevibacter sp.]|nr:ATP-binding protein [Methanobrevibacter sp.]
YKCTKGVPFYINTFARLISSDKLLTEEVVKKEFYKALPYLAIHLKSMWDKLNFPEQKIIVQLLDNPLKRVEIANNLNITSGTLSKPLVKLQDIGLIEINDERKYQIVDPILRLWLKNEYDTKGVYPYRVS